MSFIKHLNNNKFHGKIYLDTLTQLDMQLNKGLGVPSHKFPYLLQKLKLATLTSCE